MLSRRGLITGLISLAAAPAIVRASSLMPIKVMEPETFTVQRLFEMRMNAVYEETRKNMIRTLYGGFEWTATGLDNVISYRPLTDMELAFDGR